MVGRGGIRSAFTYNETSSTDDMSRVCHRNPTYQLTGEGVGFKEAVQYSLHQVAGNEIGVLREIFRDNFV